MKKLITALFLVIFCATNAFAKEVPKNIQNAIKKDFPKAEFRFDGLITLPDGTLYLPLFPALVKKPEEISVEKTYPKNQSLKNKPEIVIFNNDFTLLKIIRDMKGRKTVALLKEPPVEVRTGLLPQDLLVPSGLIIPDNIKGIIGNLEISTEKDAGLRIAAEELTQKKPKKFQPFKNLVKEVYELKNKVIYVSTCYSKNIQVVKGENSEAEYALTQETLPIDIAITPNKRFLLVTTFSKNTVDVISLADDRIIKQIDLKTPAGEILIDEIKNKAYIASPKDASIFIVNLSDMTLSKKIKIRGNCEKLYLSNDRNKIFYTDSHNNDIWVIELDNDYVIKNIGNFPNISKIVFEQNKVYASSRTKNRVAVVDYVTLGLIKELEVSPKPVDMLSYKGDIFVLSAENNSIDIINTQDDEVTETIDLSTGGFSTKLYRIEDSNKAIATNTKSNKYAVIDLDKKKVIKINELFVPISNIVITEQVRKISENE